MGTVIVRLLSVIKNLKKELRKFKKDVAQYTYLTSRGNH